MRREEWDREREPWKDQASVVGMRAATMDAPTHKRVRDGMSDEEKRR